MEYTDKQITCRDCGKEFTFTAEGQEFFASKQFSDPTRCKGCRAKKKAQKAQEGQR